MPRTHRTPPPDPAGFLRDWRQVAVLGALIIAADLSLVGVVAHEVPSTSAQAPWDWELPPPVPEWTGGPSAAVERTLPPERATPIESAAPPTATDLDASLAAGLAEIARAAGLEPGEVLPGEDLAERAREASGMDSPEGEALLEAYRAGAERVAAELKAQRGGR